MEKLAPIVTFLYAFVMHASPNKERSKGKTRNASCILRTARDAEDRTHRYVADVSHARAAAGLWGWRWRRDGLGRGLKEAVPVLLILGHPKMGSKIFEIG